MKMRQGAEVAPEKDKKKKKQRPLKNNTAGVPLEETKIAR